MANSQLYPSHARISDGRCSAFRYRTRNCSNRRALLSVSDKTGITDFAKALADRGVDLISTGGTRKAIADAGIKVKDISEITEFPEIMDGRSKRCIPVFMVVFWELGPLTITLLP